MIKRSSYQAGSVQLKERVDGPDVWVYRWRQPDGKRRSQIIGSREQYPTKAAATRAAEPFRVAANEAPAPAAVTFGTLIDRYIEKECPTRFSTRRAYTFYLNHFIRSRWGDHRIEEVNPPQAVKEWLLGLKKANGHDVAGKTRGHIKALMSKLFDFAMCMGVLKMERNPMSAFELTGTTKRQQDPRCLTVEEFQKFVIELEEPFRTIALVCVCLGLRISECLALKWFDVDWFGGRLRVERGIVCQNVGDVKTRESGKTMTIDESLLATLKAWKQATQFSANEDWIFASPMQLGALPWSYPWVWRMFQNAAKAAGVGKLSTHTMRHSYRSWLDAVGTPIAVQQKLMRHADIRTTMNVYGDVVTNEMAQAHSKVAGMVLNRKIV